MEKYNDVKIFLFFLVLLGFVVGGYILMHDSIKYYKDEPKSEENEQEVVDIRIDATKDYIYFTEYDNVEHKLDIVYQNINFNFKNFSNVEKQLNDESYKFKDSLVYDEEGNVINAQYMMYQVYNYEKYLSLVVNYYTYDTENLISFIKSDTYIFNKNSGKQITENEILNEYKFTKDDIIEIIEVHLEDENIAKENEELDVAGTIDNIDNMPLFVDKIGRLSISILVKSDQKDYNEVIVLS